MAEFALSLAIAIVAYWAGYLHGTMEGRHREKWSIPISPWWG